VPKPLIVARYFANEQRDIEDLQAELEATAAAVVELEEEHGGEEGYLGSLDKIAKAEVAARLKEIAEDESADRKAQGGKVTKTAKTAKVAEAVVSYRAGDGEKTEADVLLEWLNLNTAEAAKKRAIKEAEVTLDRLAYDKYPLLSEAEVQALVVDDKWLATLSTAIRSELDRVAQTLTGRIRTLADRYATPLPAIEAEVESLAAKVGAHLKRMKGAQG